MSETETRLLQLYRDVKTAFPEHIDIYASQEGEDVLLRRLLAPFYNDPNGFYVDVGAHHPYRFSNTLHYYLHGWRGINIDPIETAITLFNDLRTQDINICCAVSSTPGEKIFYEFSETAYNTLCLERSNTVSTKTQQPIMERTVECQKLRTIILNHNDRFNISKFMFLSVDVEGLEEDVLLSNDWEKYRPKIVLAEALTEDSLYGIINIMETFGYFIIARTKNTYFFADRKIKYYSEMNILPEWHLNSRIVTNTYIQNLNLQAAEYKKEISSLIEQQIHLKKQIELYKEKDVYTKKEFNALTTSIADLSTKYTDLLRSKLPILFALRRAYGRLRRR